MSNLEISYKGNKIRSLSVSRILFWNKGHDTIDKSDIVIANPLRVECSEGNRILDINLIEVNNPSSQFAVEMAEDATYAKITFDYLDKEQGAIIQVTHTGKTSSDISLKGNVKGAVIRRHVQRRNFVSNATSAIASVLSMLFAVVAWLTTGNLTLAWRIVVSVVVWTLSLIVLGVTSYWLDNKLSNSFPKEFKYFE